MSTGPKDQEQTDRAPAPEATGIYDPSQAKPAAADPVVPDLNATRELSGAKAPGVTGEWDGANRAGATGEWAGSNAPGATGDFVLAEGIQEEGPVEAPTPGITLAYVPKTGRTGDVLQGPPTLGLPAGEKAGGATTDYEPSRSPFLTAQQPPTKKRPSAAGTRCGRYTLTRFHARGGMGEIWVAEDPGIHRSVALKRMLAPRPDRQHRFLVEAQVTGQLEHPGIVPVHELDVDDKGQPFYTMKFVRGRTLEKVIKEYHAAKHDAGSREVEQVRLLQLFVSLCQTVAYAHSRWVLHRDIKPENVVLGPYGETLLLDWGLAKLIGQPEQPSGAPEGEAVHLESTDDGSATQSGMILGSPAYMAPEVALGLNEEVDQRSDVYLLGATLYEILSGQKPRKGNSVMEMLQEAQQQEPLPPQKVNPDVAKPLGAICQKAMAHEKADRYQSALALTEDVQRYLAGEPVSAYRENILERTWRWARRHRKALGWAAGVIALVALLLTGVIKLREAERQRQMAQAEAERLQKLEQARHDVQEFRRLADEARFFAATTDPVTEQAPYFDPREGETRARAALALARKWGEALEQLPLPEEVERVSQELYDLHLVLAQVIDQRGTAPAGARDMLAELEGARQLQPPSRSYYRLHGRACRLLGDEKGAAADQQRAEDAQTPATALDHFLLGEQYRLASVKRLKDAAEIQSWQPDPAQLEKAIAHYRQGLQASPDHYWLHFQLGRCYLSQGRLSEAVETLGTCVALRPAAPWGYSVRGLALAQQKRYPEAEQDLDRAVQLSPESRPSRLNRGVVYWAQKKQDQALADFSAVLQPPGERRIVESAYYRGQLYLQLGELEKALHDFNLVATEKPSFRPVYLLRARIHLARGDRVGALANLDEYLGGKGVADRPAWQVHDQRGRILRMQYAEVPLDQRDRPSARALANLTVAELEQAVVAGGRTAELYDDLGAMLELTGQLDKAIAAYDQGLAIAPDNIKLRLKRGWAHVQQGEYNKARADFSAATRANQDNAEAHTGMGYVVATGKSMAEAQREADLALLWGGDNYLIVHNVACIYAVLSQAKDPQAPGHEEAAMALIRKAIALWKQGSTGPSEIDLVKSEPAFAPLRSRTDFQILLQERGP